MMKILYFYSLACISCIRSSQIIQSLKQEAYDIEEYNVDLDLNVAKKHHIGTKVPVILFINKDNQEVHRIIGEFTKEELIHEIQKI